MIFLQLLACERCVSQGTEGGVVVFLSRLSGGRLAGGVLQALDYRVGMREGQGMRGKSSNSQCEPNRFAFSARKAVRTWRSVVRGEPFMVRPAHHERLQARLQVASGEVAGGFGRAREDFPFVSMLSKSQQPAEK